jgi:serine/threonine-protein kinase
MVTEAAGQDDGTVKLMDFGIARSAQPNAQQTLTAAGMVVGTADYLSPEQARGEALDARTDLYAVGCLLHELLTGWPPLVADTPLDTIWRRLREAAPAPSLLVPALSPAVDELVARALARDPANRYPDAAAMRAAVDAVLATEFDEEARVADGPGAGLDAPTRLLAGRRSAQARAVPTSEPTVLVAPPGSVAEPTLVELRTHPEGRDDRESWDEDDGQHAQGEAGEPGQARRERRRGRSGLVTAAVAVSAVLVGGWFAFGGTAGRAGGAAGGKAQGEGGGTGVNAAAAGPQLPDLTHKGLAHARRTLTGLGLHVGHLSVGDCTGSPSAPRTVCSQLPAAGTVVARGSAVNLTVSPVPGAHAGAAHPSGLAGDSGAF